MWTLTDLFRKLYSITLTLGIPFLFLRLLWRSRKNSAYRVRLLERLGIFGPRHPAPQGIWLHAVSVGESLAAIALIRALKHEFGGIPITVTTTTPQGSARIREILGDLVFHVYFPFDLPWTHALFLSRIQPKLCIIMETELWPNCLHTLKKRNIPIIIVNARLSERSMKGYRRIQNTTKSMMSCISLVAAQSLQDGERFLSLGLPKEKLEVVGNIKYDMQIAEDIEEKANALRSQWGLHRPVFIAASTHRGEEIQVLQALKELKKKYPDLLLILAPRHIDRTNEIQKLIHEFCSDSSVSHSMQSIQLSKRSEANFDHRTEILLVDTMGEMQLHYKASDVAFVGGSFVPHGGHNMLEPAALGIPCVVGPHIHNFVDIAQQLKQAGGLYQAMDQDNFVKVLDNWLSSKEDRMLAGKKALEVVNRNRGTVDKLVRSVQQYL